MANNGIKGMITSMGEAAVTEAKVKTPQGKEYVAYTIRIPKRLCKCFFNYRLCSSIC